MIKMMNIMMSPTNWRMPVNCVQAKMFVHVVDLRQGIPQQNARDRAERGEGRQPLVDDTLLDEPWVIGEVQGVCANKECFGHDLLGNTELWPFPSIVELGHIAQFACDPYQRTL